MADKTYVLLDDVIAYIASCERSNMLPVECSAITLIKNVPAADVVEVVRCRECQHYNAGFECLIEGYGIERPADYFCASGKCKVGGQDDV